MGLYLYYALPAYWAYNKAQRQLDGMVFNVVLVDKSQLDILRNDWVPRSDYVNEPFFTDGSREPFQVAGLPCNIEGIIEIYNFEMPDYKWSRTDEMKMNTYKGMLKTTILPAIDSDIYVIRGASGAYEWAYHHLDSDLILLYQNKGNDVYQTLLGKRKK